MKSLTYTAFYSVLFFCIATATAQSTTADMNLKGNVWRLFTNKHQAKNIVIENNKLVSYEKTVLLNHVDYIFDKKGALLAENTFNKQDIIDISYIYEYDKSGRLTEKTIAKSGKILVERTEYKYNPDGKKLQEIDFDNRDSLRSSIAYKYDSLGKLISEKTYNNVNRLIKNIEYQYDEWGNLLLENSLPTNVYLNRPYQKVQKFDSKNNCIYKSYTRQDTLQWEYFASYNKKDSLIYEEVKDGNGNLQSYSKLTYRKNRRIALVQHQRDAVVPIIETHYQYDKAGKLLTEKLYTPNNKQLLVIRTYFYDEKGNWIYCLEEEVINKVKNVFSRRFNYF